MAVDAYSFEAQGLVSELLGSPKNGKTCTTKEGQMRVKEDSLEMGPHLLKKSGK